MHDLRHDPDAHTPARREPTWFAGSDTATVPAHVLTPEQLRVVPMPNLRSPDARTLDADARDLPIRGYSAIDDWALRHTPDCRTADDKLVAELVRLVDALQALTLRVDVMIEDQTRTITELDAYIRDHSEVD